MKLNVKTSPADLLRDLPNVFSRAADLNLNVDSYLERMDPSSEYDAEDRSDAFTRILREAAVITNGNPSAGLYATDLASVYNGTHKDAEGEEIGIERGRALLQIWAMRRWREAKYGKSASTRSMFTTEEEALGSIFRPYAENGDPRVVGLTPQIPISELIATNTPISSTGYKVVYFDQPEMDDLTMVRVAEGAEIPRAHLKLRDQEVRIHKYARAFDWTYEVARQTRLDKLRMMIQHIALATEASKVGRIVSVLIAGDGNTGTAAVAIDVSDLDTAAVNSALTLRAYLGMKKLFKAPFTMTTILAGAEEITDLEMLPVNSNQMPLITVPANTGIGGIAPINAPNAAGNSIRYGYVENGEVSADHYLAFDRNAAIERVYDVGATVSEADRFITNQTEVMTFSESEGYAKMYGDAAYLIDMTQ